MLKLNYKQINFLSGQSKIIALAEILSQGLSSFSFDGAVFLSGGFPITVFNEIQV